MASDHYHLATVLLFDPDPSLRQNTRSALLNIGFGEVVAVEEFAHFIDQVETGSFDLVLADSRSFEGDTLEVVHQIRRAALGQNPFVNVIVSLWDTAPEIVGSVINSGVDDLISRPMSRSQIRQRVERLVHARKPFIVTTDYIGPDRRQVPRGYPEGSTMIVPNSLQAKVENKPEFDATPEAIEATMKAVNNRKISLFTEQLLRLSSAIILLSSGFDEMEDRTGVARAMREITERLSTRIAGTRFAHVGALCEGLRDLLTTVEKSRDPLADQERELLQQIPLAINKACTEVQESASLIFDIRDVSSKLRQRRPKTRSLNPEPRP